MCVFQCVPPASSDRTASDDAPAMGRPWCVTTLRGPAPVCPASRDASAIRVSPSSSFFLSRDMKCDIMPVFGTEDCCEHCPLRVPRRRIHFSLSLRALRPELWAGVCLQEQRHLCGHRRLLHLFARLLWRCLHRRFHSPSRIDGRSVCPAGRFGRDCMSVCECHNGASCSHVDGVCECKVRRKTRKKNVQSGWSGVHCDQPCEVGRFGKNCEKKCDCLSPNMACDADGECICPPGKRGKLCEEREFPLTSRRPACPVGHFGAGCQGICLCANNATCDAQTGACTCGAGWRGKHCDRPCRDGFYGQTCRHECKCSLTSLFSSFPSRRLQKTRIWQHSSRSATP